MLLYNNASGGGAIEGKIFMFTFTCSTCEAKLIVKNEKLIGKILACPNCGSMVYVESPDDDPTPPHLPPKPTVHKRFPDILSYETASGIIGHVPEENRLSGFLLDTVSEPNVTGTDIKTRKILVGILLGLSVFLLVALGFLMVVPQKGEKGESPQPPQEPILPVPVVLSPVELNLDEPVEIFDILPHEEEPRFESESIQSELIPILEGNDTLAAFDEKMPGFVDISIPNIDMDAKLALPVLELNINQTRLVGFIRDMSRMTEIPMTLDIDELKPHSLSAKTPIDRQFKEATVERVLTDALATLGLQWMITDRQILILPKATTDAVDLAFDVSDFAEKTDDLKSEKLADMIQKLFYPDGNITVSPDSRLTVTQDEAYGKSQQRQRDEILRFLDQLRVVRQLPQKTEWTGETLAPEAFGWDKVMEPMSLHYYRAVPLARAVRQLEEQTQLTILVDHQSLHRSLCSFASMQATVQCDRGTVNDALELLLASVDSVSLAYRIIDHQTLEITTAESARQPEKMVVEVHRYQLREDETPEGIVRLLRSTVAPESWERTEIPDTKYGGNIVIDEPSHCLFIRQNQPVQRKIRLYLSDSATFPAVLANEE